MRHVVIAVLIVVLLTAVAAFGAGWKWGSPGQKEAGFSWDEGSATFVWVND